MNPWMKAALASLLLISCAGADPTTVPSNVDSLIKQLSDSDIAVREQAQAALAAAGESAIEAMKAARDSTQDPDVQLRLEALIVRYSEDLAVGASRITLKFDDAPLKDVLAELTRQSKAIFADPVQDFGNDPPRITIDVTDVSFWKALETLRSGGRVNFVPQGDIWRATRNFGNQLFNGNAIEAGAFLIQPMNASYSRTISYAPNAGAGENFTLSFQILCEPKIHMTQSAGQFRLTRAVDSNGNNLVGPNVMQTFGIGQNVFHVATQLAYPKQPGAKIDELSGTMKLNIARNVESLTIEDFNATSKPVQQTLDGAKITITPDNANAGQPNWVTMLVVIEPNGDMSAMNRLQQVIRQVRITDNEGRPLQLNGFQGSSVNAQRGEYRLSFMPMGNGVANRPLKVSLDVPTSYREVEVPFTIKDLKMP